MQQIILLSGQVGAGKTTLASKLETRFGYRHFKTKDFLVLRCQEIQLERSALQKFGEHLDTKTGGSWVLEHVESYLRVEKDISPIVVDSVRHVGQIDAVRKAYGRRVVHVHLEADLKELERRYANRQTAIKELTSYQLVQQNKT